jgi:hypothetical protein
LERKNDEERITMTMKSKMKMKMIGRSPKRIETGPWATSKSGYMAICVQNLVEM